MEKTVNLAEITNGKMMGTLQIKAEGWSTRYSWGHTAEIWANGELAASCRYRYYNRTWESYRFKSVLHGVISKYVEGVTGINPYKSISARDGKPMKDAAAESRRLARVAARDFAVGLNNALCGIVDGIEASKCKVLAA